jgi:uncharacterized protein
MPLALLERYIRQHLEAASGGDVLFSWHGGEPTLAGIGFYRRVVELQEKYRGPGLKVTNGIQTNGTLLDQKWCEFLRQASFIVGVSMDGPAHLHDHFRLSKDGKPTHSRVMHGYAMLMRYGIPVEVLCVVNAVNVDYPLEIYRYFRETGARYLTFLPLVERVKGDAGEVSQRSVPARKFGEFLCRVFDEWKAQDIGAIKVQIFEEALRTAFRQDHTLCIFKRRCGGVPVVERNGDVYSCDHYVDPGHRIGNIGLHNLVDMLDHPKQAAFGAAKEVTLPRYCLECEVRGMCNGECPRNRFIPAPDGEPGLNYLCQGYRLFFNHCKPMVDAVAAQWSNPLASL